MKSMFVNNNNNNQIEIDVEYTYNTLHTIIINGKQYKQYNNVYRLNNSNNNNQMIWIIG